MGKNARKNRKDSLKDHPPDVHTTDLDLPSGWTKWTFGMTRDAKQVWWLKWRRLQSLYGTVFLMSPLLQLPASALQGVSRLNAISLESGR